MEPDTNVSESEIDQISFYLKHVSGVKIPGNLSVSEMSLTWAIIVEPDTKVSEGVIHQKPFQGDSTLRDFQAPEVLLLRLARLLPPSSLAMNI